MTAFWDRTLRRLRLPLEWGKHPANRHFSTFPGPAPDLLIPGIRDGGSSCSERSATTESGAASGQRMPFPDYVSAQGPVPTPWTQVDPVVFSRLRRAAPGDLQRPCGCAWSNSGRMVENVSRRARSVDVFQQGRFLFPCQPLTSPLPKSQPKCIKGWPFCKRRLQ